MSTIQTFSSTHQHWLATETSESIATSTHTKPLTHLIQQHILSPQKKTSNFPSTTQAPLSIENHNQLENLEEKYNKWVENLEEKYNKWFENLEEKYNKWVENLEEFINNLNIEFILGTDLAELVEKAEEYLNDLPLESLVQALDSEPELHHLSTLIKEGLQRTGLSPASTSITSLLESLENAQMNIPDAVFFQKFERALCDYQGINWAPCLLKALQNQANPYSRILQVGTFIHFQRHCEDALGKKATTEILLKVMSGAPLSQDSIDKIAGQKKISTLAQKTLGIMPPESDTEVDRRYFLFGEGSKEVLPLFETAIRQAGQIKWSDLEDYISDTPPPSIQVKKTPQ